MRELEVSHQDPASDVDINENTQSDLMELDLNYGRRINGELEDYPVGGNYNWDPMPADSDEERMSERSWDCVGTPPPSPPSSPLPGASDEEVDEDEDGFLNITAEDYREYDCWFGEEEEQINEILAETLTEEEMDSFKMLCIRLFGHISQRNYERIRYSFKDKIQLLSTYCLHKKLAQLSGIKPVTVDCCINICHAFNGDYTAETEKGAMDEFWDSTLYKRLTRTEIVVEGEPQGVRYFDKVNGRRDIAYAIMLDGVETQDRAASGHSSCWPLMGINLNLAPSERVKMKNLIPLGIIPGPKQPKDFNSFLLPFVEEALDQARGVQTFDIITGTYFTLRAHPVFISGNMQAIKHVIEMKGVNAKCPCRACELTAIYLADAKTYYIPLANPRDNPDAIPDDRTSPGFNPAETSFDPLNLPLRTHDCIQQQLAEMDAAPTRKQYDSLAKEYGLTGHSILDRIPSIRRPDSYPHEFMHLFLLNHGPDLVALWTGTCKGIETKYGKYKYLISFEHWSEAGRETEEATKTLAAAFIRPFPNIQTHIECFCAEHWAFWLVYIGPVVLRGRLPQKFYDHYLELVSILKCLLSVNNTVARIEALREKIANYVETFEKYYYQYKYERLRVCKLTLHALLHVPDDVLRCGPVWVAWSFSIERYCREVTACARSKVLPWTAIAKYVLQMSQLSALACRFPELRKAMLFGKNNVPVAASRMEEIKPGYEERVLRFPRLRDFFLKPSVRWRVAQYFYTNYPDNTFREWLAFIPERCERWGKLRVRNAEDTGAGDCIRSAVACNPLSPYGKRDALFIRYTFQRDKNERNRKAPEMVDVYAYGRLDFILAITLPANQRFKINTPKLHVLAQITEADGAEGDAASELITFTKFGRSIVLDVSSVLSLAGRVFTRGAKATGEWAIIDRSEDIQQTAFDIPEEDQEDEGEYVE
ncbi:unnamed protein product [Rhizoctonia solani]|uniref:Transposase family Tnp2 protein n=1 Tax=Rhizoctonia solani TaxID=456999 RepID=A0A8H3BP44_9AGAM|nr:unnamed protein product [Rhizoctonia solani]